MVDIFKKIVSWNKKKGLLGKEFSLSKEIGYIVEELYESTGKYKGDKAREKGLLLGEEIAKEGNGEKEDIVDAFGDIIVYSIGAIAKIGYNPKKVLKEIYKEINSREGENIAGRFVKNKNIKTYKADFDKCKI